MITLFNRKKLWLDSAPEEAARVWSALEQAGISYELKPCATTLPLAATSAPTGAIEIFRGESVTPTWRTGCATPM